MDYDAAGSLTSLNDATLTYGAWGQLSGIDGLPAGAVSYSYDSSGRRVSKTVGNQTTYYLYDGNLLIAEVDSTGHLTTAYTWGAQGLISDRAQSGNGTQSRFYLFDALGNTRALVDGAGNVLGWAAYTAWGSAYAGQLPTTPFGWEGRWGLYTDAESGLTLCGARYYAACMGRFISRDPSGFSSGPNLYSYCDGDPIDFYDANGMWPTYNDISRWYWGGMGGTSEIVDKGIALIDRVGGIAISPFLNPSLLAPLEGPTEHAGTMAHGVSSAESMVFLPER